MKNLKPDLYTIIIGEGNVIEGMSRFLLAISAFFIAFGTFMWAVWPS